MRGGRNVLYLFIFFLIMINYADRVALSIGSKAVSDEFHLTPVQMGYLLSSFTWTYVLFLLPWGTAVDRIRAEGNVAISSPPYTAHGDHGTYERLVG